MGSLRGHVCETLRDLRGVLCSQGARCRLRTGRARVLAWRTPRIARFVLFFYARVTSWLPARVVGSPAGGSNSLPDGSVHVGRGARQLPDVTGKVQHVRLCLPCKGARGASCRAGRAGKFKMNQFGTRKSKPRFRVNMIPLGRGEKPPVPGHRIYL